MSRCYIVAGNIIDAVILQGKSFKSYCSSVKVGKVDYLLAAECLKYRTVLETLFGQIGLKLNPKNLGVRYGLFMVMMYEMLFGKKKINGGGAVKRKVMEYHEKMKDKLKDIMMEMMIDNSAELLPKNVQQANNLNIYIRINEIKMNIEDGFKVIKNLISTAMVDQHIPSLIVLPSGTRSFGQHEFVKIGNFIIQDKASCMPSQILYEQWLSYPGDIIDCCAAPGNKTSHLASQLHCYTKTISGDNPNIKYKVFAFDKSPSRCELLKSRMETAGASHIVSVANRDFLTVNPLDPLYSNVTAILLDPSCSGSGVVVCRT